MARTKRLPADAKPVTIYLGGAERVALSLIEACRQRRLESGDSPSEIVADTLHYYLSRKEKINGKQIEDLLPPIESKKKNRRTPKER